MRRRLYIAICLLFILATSGFSEMLIPYEHLPTTDEKIKSLQGDFDKAMEHSNVDAAYDISFNLVQAYRGKMQYKKTLHYLKLQRKLGKELKSVVKELNPLMEMSNTQLAMGIDLDGLYDNLLYAKSFINHDSLTVDDRSNIYGCLASYHIGQAKLDSTIIYRKKAYQVIEGYDEYMSSYVMNRCRLAKTLTLNNELTASMQLLLDTEKLLEHEGVTAIDKNFFYGQIFILLTLIKDFESAKAYLKLTREFAEKTKMKFKIAEVALHSGETEIQLGNIEEGKQLIRQALEHSSNSKIKKNVAKTYLALAEGLKLSDSLNLYKRYLDSAQQYIVLEKSVLIKDRLLLNYAGYYLQANQSEKAKSFLDQIEKPDWQKALYLHQYHNQRGENKTALGFYKSAVNERDSLNDLHQALRVKRMESMFNREQQETKITALTVANKAQDKALKTRNNALFIGSVMLCFLAALLFLLFRANKRNKENKEQLADKNSKLSSTLAQNQLLLKEIHHRVKNNLQVISSLLNMQARKVSDEGTKNALKSSKTRVQSMSILHRNLYEGENLKEVAFGQYMEQLVQNIIATYLVEDNIKFEYDIDPMSMDIDTMVPLGLIANEIICNAIKHAFVGRANGKLKIALKEKGNQVLLKIADDGVGFEGDTLPVRTDSLGNRLINSLVQRLDGQLTLSGDQGASYSILFNRDKLGLEQFPSLKAV